MAKHPAHKKHPKHASKARPVHHARKKRAPKHGAVIEHPEHYVSPELPGTSFSPQPGKHEELTKTAEARRREETKLLEAETESGHEERLEYETHEHVDHHRQETEFDPTARPAQTERNGEQQAALYEMRLRSTETNRFVYQRAKSLLVAAILLSLMSLYGLIRSFMSDDNSINFVALPVSLVTLGMSAYLFYARDHHLVSLVIKIFIIVQFINFFSSLYSNVDIAVLNGIALAYLLFVYARVKSLKYY